MKKDPESQLDDELLPEYDFRGGVRGKHFRAYQQGHTGCLAATSLGA